MLGALKIASLLAVLLGAVALSSCGDEANNREAKNAYVRDLNTAQQAFAVSASEVSQQGAKSLGQYRRTLRRFEVTIAAFEEKLRAIEVPSVVVEEHEQLIAALTKFGTDFKAVSVALDNPSARALGEAQNAITTATQRANTRIEAAAAAIDSKLRDT